jgi:predicted Na+-dependent transporter
VFASKSIALHLGRGVLGFGAIAVASTFATEAPWSMLVALPVALFALPHVLDGWTRANCYRKRARRLAC